ncbi:MAG: hypothetical protein LBV31_01925 [Prevotellaceae bacterium]|jgi:hypothetical protein|nr:hypothetical protein [Prevotellaceae bacterium]
MKILQKTMAILLALLYLGTTTGFAVADCHAKGKPEFLFLQASNDCACHAEKKAAQRNAENTCCDSSHDENTHDERGLNLQLLQNGNGNVCCSLFFTSLETQTNIPNDVSNLKSVSFCNYILLPNTEGDFIYAPKNTLSATNYVHSLFAGKTLPIYHFCQMRC